MAKKISLKRILSLLLSLILVLTPVISLTAIAQEVTDGRRYPTIYVRGKVAAIYKNWGTDEQEKIFDEWTGRVPVPDGYIADKAKELLPKFAKAIITDNYDEWAEEFSQVLAPIYQEIVLDNHAQPRPDTHSSWTYDPNTLDNRVRGDSTYDTESYTFEYDWRLSPIQVAEELYAYVSDVLRVTRAEKYNLVARCEGACIAIAYLAAHGDERINATVFLTPCSNGCAQISEIFAGDMKITGDALNRYMSLNFGTDAEDGFGGDYFQDEVLLAFLRDTISMLALTHGLDLPASAVVNIFNKIKERVYPGIMMTSYGTFPGYWAMVDDAHYETAKSLAGLNGNSEWADYVAILDDYHYNIQNRQVEIIRALMDQGMSFSLLVKYGTEILPFIASAELINDSTVTVDESSFGATTAKVGTVLDSAYIEAAAENGTAKYISPDLQIDASTAAFPDNTWFMKYCPHGEWYQSVYWWLDTVIANGIAADAHSTENYPQFMFWNRENGSVSPLTEENAGTYENYYKRSPFQALADFFTSLFKTLTKLIESIKNAIIRE